MEVHADAVDALVGPEGGEAEHELPSAWFPRRGGRRAAFDWPVTLPPRGCQLLSLLLQLERSQWRTPEEIRDCQKPLLGNLLRHAYKACPWYRQRFDQAGLVLDSIVSQRDWRRIPILRRTDVQMAGSDLQAKTIPGGHGRVGTVVTSGSTGRPIVVQSTALTRLMHDVFTLREHEWHQRNFASHFAAIRFMNEPACAPPRGYRGKQWGSATRWVCRTGPVSVLHIGCDLETQVSWLQERDPDYLLTYPSNLAALVRHMSARRLKPNSLRQVLTFGELLSSEIRQLVATCWQMKVIDAYSAQEVSSIALQCPDHSHYHVQEENVLVEVLDCDDQPCRPGEVGRVVLTSLHNYATPLIRYEIGDYAEVGEPCPCGRGLQVLKRIVGRERNMMVLPDGRLRWPSWEIEAADLAGNLPPISQFQVIQRSLSAVDVLLVTPRPLTSSEELKIQEWTLKALGYPFQVTLRYVDQIKPGPTGKFEDFRCEVPSSGSMALGESC